jgi:hypothetical protein
MSKQTIKGGIYYDTDRVSELCYGTRYRFFPGSPGNFATYVSVCEHELTFDLPANFDPRPIEIKALEEKAKEIQAEATAKCTEIFRRISELQAITHEPEAA